MNAYRVIAPDYIGGPVRPAYLGTLALAHADAKEHGRNALPDIRIELVEVDTSKAGVLALLNGDEPEEAAVIRTWRLGARGGLVECPNGE